MDDRFRVPFLTQWTTCRVSAPPPVTVVETPEFLSATRKLMPDGDGAGLVDYLAHNPMAGAVISRHRRGAQAAPGAGG